MDVANTGNCPQLTNGSFEGLVRGGVLERLPVNVGSAIGNAPNKVEESLGFVGHAPGLWTSACYRDCGKARACSTNDDPSAISAHDLDEPRDRARDRDARRVGRWFTEGKRNLFVTLLQLDARDDRFAV